MVDGAEKEAFLTRIAVEDRVKIVSSLTDLYHKTTLAKVIDRFIHEAVPMRGSVRQVQDICGSVQPGSYNPCLCPTLRALTTVMKTAVNGKKTKTKNVIGFKWTGECQRAFQAVKKAVTENALSGGDPSLQYHLATDASATGLGGVLFQLPANAPHTMAFSVPTSEHLVVMYLGYQLIPAERNYQTTEREALAVLKCLEEVRWLVHGSDFPVKVYTDHSALVHLLKSDKAIFRERLDRGFIRMAPEELPRSPHIFVRIPRAYDGPHGSYQGVPRGGGIHCQRGDHRQVSAGYPGWYNRYPWYRPDLGTYEYRKDGRATLRGTWQ